MGLSIFLLWVTLETGSRGERIPEGWVPILIISVVVTMIWRLTGAPSVLARGELLVVEQVTHRWIVPRGAITGVVGGSTLDVVTHERTITAHAAPRSLVSELTGNPRQKRAALALRQWRGAGATTEQTPTDSERVSFMPPLRDLACFVITLQILYWGGLLLTG